MGYSSIILKGDAQTIVKALNKRVYGKKWHDNIILDMRGILKKIYSWSVSHVRREENKGVHLLAKYAVSRPLC
jgi:hypothetical protein